MEKNNFFGFIHNSIINHSAGGNVNIPLSALIVPQDFEEDSIFESVQIIKEKLLKITEKMKENSERDFYMRLKYGTKRTPSYSPDTEILIIHIKKLLAPTIFYIEGAGNKSGNEQQITQAHSLRKRLLIVLRKLQELLIIDESVMKMLLPPVRKEEY